jgi:hypothetical protein
MGRPIISGRYELGPFRDEFSHCGSTADLFAQVTASAHGNVRLAVDLLATALNEMLEWAYRSTDHNQSGEMSLEVVEDGNSLRLSLTLPLAAGQSARLLEQLSGLQAEVARGRLLRSVESESAQCDPMLGLYWLAAEFGAISGTEQGEDRVRLNLDLQG